MDTDGEPKSSSPEVSVCPSGTDLGEAVFKCLTDSSTDKTVLSIDGEVQCQNQSSSSVDRTGDTSDSGHSAIDEGIQYVVPQLGAEFESDNHAYKCYVRYAAMEGFSVRKDFINKNKASGLVISRRYTCHRQGYRCNKRDANVKKPRLDTRTGCLAYMTISRQANGKYCVTHFEGKHNHELATPLTAHQLPSLRRICFSKAVEAELANNSSALDGVPKLGMGFESDDHAYEFYNAYALRVGFCVRKDYVNRSRVDGAVGSRRFTCSREGFRREDKRDSNTKRPRKETRIGCLAQLVIGRQGDGVYRVTHFEENHNHEFLPAWRLRLLRSQKSSAAGQPVESASEGDGESHNYNLVNHSSKLQSKRTRDMKEGEAEIILGYLQSRQLKDPSFIYAVQLDVEEQLTNIFWADSKMLADYADFGDVVCFDTGYRKNQDFRPLSLFLGVNNHKQMIVFGAALLYDETVESVKWLLRTITETMSGKKPKTVLIDQDAVVAEAVRDELPETVHRLCAWHVYQNALEKLGQVVRSSDSFTTDLSSCIFDNDQEEDFLNAWKVVLDSYAFSEDECFNEMFQEREKWALPYVRSTFCADIQRTQLCENLNVNLRKCLKSALDVSQLFKHVGKVVNDLRYKEIEANYDMSHHVPRLIGDVIMLKHTREAYTPKVFELFQQEYENCLNCIISQCSESEAVVEYKVSIYGESREHTVVYNSSEGSVFCSCMKFEFVGILCSHALKVLDYRNIKIIPGMYILKRWTKDARV